jgi:hypothetical protein
MKATMKMSRMQTPNPKAMASKQAATMDRTISSPFQRTWSPTRPRISETTPLPWTKPYLG